VLPPGKIYPPGSLIKGQPARVERALSSEERDKIGQHYLSYVQYKNRYLQESNPC
jgi:carbonic anhydrase/acetyltransferase-like protein (isoleucine patch superfamily)